MAARDKGAAAILPLDPYQISVTYRGAGSDWFGPLKPLKPVAPLDVIGRQFDYPNGYNVNTRPRAYSRIGFPELRALADNYDLLRIIIETRKDQVEGRQWTIRPNQEEFGIGKGKPPEALLNRCKEIRAFFKKPDRRTGWKPWLRELLEQLFVYDAPTLYQQPNRGGGIYGFEVIDGATIVPKIDEGGRIAMYQQVLKGLPAVDYSMEQLIYRPRNVRADRVYGYSPVEQIIVTVNIALRRQIWQLQYYTEGNIPDSLIGVPETWTPDQLAQFQLYWDALLEGDTAQRRHAKFVPGGVGKTFIETKNPELFNKQDEWLARIVCFAFSVSQQPFVQMMNRATGETAKETSIEEGLGPTLGWVKSVMDEIIADRLKEPDIEFAWVEDESIDPTAEAEILAKLTDRPIFAPNEARARLGKEAFSDPEMDLPGSMTPSGWMSLKAQAEQRRATAEAAKNLRQAFGGENEDEKKADKKPGEVGKAADVPFAKRYRRVRPLKPTRPAARKAAASLKEAITPLLQKAGAEVAAEVARKLNEELSKADESDAERQRRIQSIADRIASSVDLSGLDVLVNVTAEEIEAFVKDTGGRILAQLGVDNERDLVDQVNERAVTMARKRAAELVGKKWVGNELIDNPDAEYRIDTGTRDMIRRTIADGLSDNIGLDEITENIVELGFSEERAELIATTEIARANSDAALMSYEAAQDAGVTVLKEWILGPNPCEICEGNHDAGAIGIDEAFPSGDDAPPAHPHCMCAVSPVVEDE